MTQSIDERKAKEEQNERNGKEGEFDDDKMKETLKSFEPTTNPSSIVVHCGDNVDKSSIKEDGGESLNRTHNLKY